MKRRSSLYVAAGIAAGGVLLLLDALMERRKETVTIDQEMPAPAERVIDLIMRVEREPEFIPIISSVQVLERMDNEVVYIVKAADPLHLSVRYRKWRQSNPPLVRWETLRGALGFRQNGEIGFTESDGKCVAHLRSEHWLTAPLLGRIAGPAATGIIRSGLGTWMKHIADELQSKPVPAS